MAIGLPASMCKVSLRNNGPANWVHENTLSWKISFEYEIIQQLMFSRAKGWHKKNRN